MSTQSFAEPAEADIRLADVLRALSDPVRLRILATLADGEFHPCSPGLYEVSVSKSTLSHHFRTLREAGLTTTLVQGRSSQIRLRREALDARFPGLIQAIEPTAPGS